MTPREENARKAARRRFEARNLINRYKKRNPKCTDCGLPWQPCQLDFYRPQGGPSRAISRRLLRSLEVIQREMEDETYYRYNPRRKRSFAKAATGA